MAPPDKSEFLADDKDVKAVAPGFNAFGAKLHAELKDGNSIYSPFSASVALAMCRFGAEGDTATQIDKVFGFPAEDVLGRAIQRVLTSLQEKNENYDLAVANRIFPAHGTELSEDFVKNIKDFFLSTVEPLDFTKGKAATAKINAWIKTATRGMIKEAVEPDPQAKLVLVNAMYFKGKWQVEFEKKNTKAKTFHLTKKTDKKVQMMFQNRKSALGTFKKLDARALELKYKGGRLAMLIFLPNEIDGLKKIEAGLKDLTYKKVMAEVKGRQSVDVYLPRFKFENRIDLLPILTKMGIKDAFDGNLADFDRIEEGGGLFISKVEQLAVIEVNEKGTKAAAVTYALVKASCAAPKKKQRLEFNVDRPFYFQIVDHQSKMVLFAGTVTDPKD